MKIVFEHGDIAIYENERCVVQGVIKTFRDTKAYHVLRPNKDVVLVPASTLVAPDTWLLERCVQLLSAHDQWEAALTLDAEDSLVETLSPDNYETLLRLQEEREKIGRLILEQEETKRENR